LVIRMNYAMNLMVSSFPSSYSFVVAWWHNAISCHDTCCVYSFMTVQRMWFLLTCKDSLEVNN
jgi:hypothetical protein